MQSKLSASLLSALSLSRFAFAQSAAPVPLPEITGGGQVITCGGCYVVAGVAAVVFGQEVLQVSQVNNQIVSGNTTVTTTVTVEEAPFTLERPSGLIVPSNVPASTVDLEGSTVVFNGLTLTSPTAYNIITAFSTTRTTTGADGQCSITLGSPVAVSPPFMVTIPTTVTDLASFQIEVESMFLANRGIPNDCSGGGANFTITSVMSTSTTTIDITTTLSSTSANLTAQAEVTTSTPSSTVVPTTTSANPLITFPALTSGNVSFTIPSSGESVIPIGPTGSLATATNLVTIVPAAGPVNRPSTLTALLSGFVAMIVGLVA